MFCRHCRIQVPDGVTFCPVCGREIREPMPLLKRMRSLIRNRDEKSGKKFQIKNKNHKKKDRQKEIIYSCAG